MTGSPVRVVHLLHDCGIGGVQTIAAGLSEPGFEGDRRIDYRTMVLAPPAADELRSFEPYAFGRGLNRLGSVGAVLALVSRERPDVLVCSLWRSVVAGLLAKLVHRRMRLVVFVHNDTYTHALDRLAHGAGLARADAAFVDGEASRRLVRRDGPAGLPTAVLPVPAGPCTPVAAVDPDTVRLVYWGRLAPQKRLDRVLDLVAILAERCPVRLKIIGPDGGDGERLRQHATRRGIASLIEWVGPLSRPRMRDAAVGSQFFVSLSDFEGFGIAVVEAMQLGLVPVVTPVGDVAEHCDHLLDAIQVTDLAAAAATIEEVWLDRDRWLAMSAAAARRWHHGPALHTAFEARCLAVAGAGEPEAVQATVELASPAAIGRPR